MDLFSLLFTRFAEFEPFIEHVDVSYSGKQLIFRFPNNYGASVILAGPFRGTRSEMFELAVLDFSEDGRGEITYETPITDSVLGWIDEGKVVSTLNRIRNLH